MIDPPMTGADLVVVVVPCSLVGAAVLSVPPESSPHADATMTNAAAAPSMAMR
ncbi:MAG: hypothetical protein ABI658_32570 [Acidimicrobiales bacterium]